MTGKQKRAGMPPPLAKDFRVSWRQSGPAFIAELEEYDPGTGHKRLILAVSGLKPTSALEALAGALQWAAADAIDKANDFGEHDG